MTAVTGADLAALEAAAALGAAAPDDRAPVHRLERLFDPGTVVHRPAVEGSGVGWATGRMAGVAAVGFSTDPRTMGGALGAAGCGVIVAAVEEARARRVPVVGIWHSGGARLGEGVRSLDGMGRVFAATVRASGEIPQLSVVIGPAAGGAAYGPALTDVVVIAPTGRLFVTGPDVVRSVTGEQVDMESLGGPRLHGERSGVAHVLAVDVEDAYERTRRLVGLVGGPRRPAFPGPEERPDPGALLPASRVRAYDVRPVLAALLDGPPEELQARWARNVVTGFARLGGRTVGVVANNPLRKGGCLDSLSAEKAARFVRLCDQLGVPLLVVVDVPGYLPGLDQERDGVVRRGAKLLHAFADASVPRITLITRKAYGGAYIAMNGRSLGATAVFAWPDAEVAVMSAVAAVGVLHRRVLGAVAGEERARMVTRLADEHRRETGGVARAVELGLVDEIVAPADTRARLIRAFAAAPAGRGRHRNIPL
jgi:acetyl-CoA/propionyl-CoA carboxylase carboxyl transferase subunit